MDLANNEIVAWSVSEHPNMAQINEMMAMLELRLDGPALLHSDQVATSTEVVTAEAGEFGESRRHVEESDLPGQRLHGGDSSGSMNERKSSSGSRVRGSLGVVQELAGRLPISPIGARGAIRSA